MNWKNRVTDILGSQYPIIQGAFAGFGTSALAAPVSDAGGFGIITAGALHTPEGLREDIRKARSMTDKPFGINLSVGLCPHIDEMREVAIEERVPVIFTAVYRSQRDRLAVSFPLENDEGSEEAIHSVSRTFPDNAFEEIK